MSELGMEQTPVSETNLDSPGSMILKVLYEPSKVFHRISIKPTWVLPFILFLLVMMINSYFITPLAMEKKTQEIRDNVELSQEQRDQQLQQMEVAKKFAVIFGMVGTPIGVGIVMMAITGILLLMGSVVFGGDSTFLKVLSLVSFSSIIGIVGTIVKLPLMLYRHDIDVRTSLALLLPGSDTSSFLFMLLNTVTDVFFIWQIAVTIIGMAIIYKFDKQKAALSVLIPVVVIFGIIGLVKAIV